MDKSVAAKPEEILAHNVKILIVLPGINDRSGDRNRKKRFPGVTISTHRGFVPQDNPVIGTLNRKVGRHRSPGRQNNIASLFQRLEPAVLRHIMKKPMTCINIQNLDAVVVQEAGDPVEVRPVAKKNGILLVGNEPVVIFMDDVELYIPVLKTS